MNDAVHSFLFADHALFLSFLWYFHYSPFRREKRARLLALTKFLHNKTTLFSFACVFKIRYNKIKRTGRD